jgi:hypothetical protein
VVDKFTLAGSALASHLSVTRVVTGIGMRTPICVKSRSCRVTEGEYQDGKATCDMHRMKCDILALLLRIR